MTTDNVTITAPGKVTTFKGFVVKRFSAALHRAGPPEAAFPRTSRDAARLLVERAVQKFAGSRRTAWGSRTSASFA
jgi:hypothetical protein